MKTFDRSASSTVFSTRVLSHDECSILVETGNTEPTISFLARAVAGGLDDDEDNIDGKPPAKRRKITVHDKGNVKQHEIQPAPKTILLGRITLDFNFATSLDNIGGRKHGRDNDSHISVSLTSVQQVDDVLSLKVRLPSKLGAVLCIDAAAVASDVYEGLQRCISNAKSKDRPASVYTCHLRRSKGNTLSLKASLSWLSGVSAFPAGAPVGKTRVYEDYDLYSHFFPDLERSTIDHGGSWTPQDFYESVYTTDKTVKVELDDLTDTPLFPFQQRTVHWMLAREHVDRPSRSYPYLHDTSFLQQGQDALGEAIFHDPLQAMLLSERSSNESFSGGILAEEMGLGKSLEITALIAGHPCPGRQSVVLDKPSQTEVVPSKATLIIGPAVIIHQWRSELSQHAPKLKVFVYTGINNDIDQIDKLANDYDVVLTSYQTLAHEVHFATDPPERNMRHQRKYERKKSPLIQILWWRICLDEAQMVESGVTAAARVACRLPRVHSWAVSGTPVKRNVEDLYGLLVFLRLEPFASNGKLWSHLITNHRHLFKRLFGTIALRHTKAQVRDEITLPPQKRVVMSLPFTAVESQHYLTLFSEMCKDVGVGSDGSPASGEWNPNDPRVVETMRNWLVRLRQTCLHPQVGHKNRRRLGRSQGPLRTVAEVLDVMIEQNESATRLEERGMIQAQIARAHIIGNARDDQTRSKKSLLIYRSAQVKCEAFVKEARERLAAAVTNGEGATEAQSDDEDSSSEAAPLVGRLRNALRAALQLLHVSVYFAATATYQIKVNEEITIPDSDEFKELEQQEVALYERAKLIRKEILKDASTKAERAMSKIKDMRTSATLLQLPALKDLDKVGGIESRRIVTTSYDLFDLIRDMQPHIYEWREMIMNILTKPLVDEDDSTNEITGDEYEESTKQQDELYVYFDALKTLQADLNRCVTGETAPLIDHEAKSLMRGAKRWLDPEVPTELKEQPHAPELLLKLFGIRQAFRTKLDSVNSVRGLIAEARHLQDGPQLGGRALAESEIAKRLLRELQVILSSYTKALAQLQKEIELCGETQNLRLEFYRQLQELSDAVAPYKEDLDETLDTTAMERALDNEELFSSSLAELRTKHRFLMHLKEESTQQESARICVICQSSFDNGVLTVCGHQYCKECIQHWWAAHRTCPVCKRRLALVDFHNITYKPQEVKVQEEHHMLPEVATDSSLPAELTSIYSEVDPQLREQIKSADLSSSYGTKIDTLSRHLLWIREHDPGAKSIVFSQYREFLDVLSTAFSEFKIGYARLGRTNAVENFRQNPSIDCLLLDAKTDSSGLTLVNATHVFICEPLVQTAVELQAIARVHRIGQTRPTTVWMYLVNDTVEESIYEISVKRRLAHVQARQVSKATQSGASTPALGEQAIDAANSEELQNAPLSKLLATGKGGGELVEKSDLWQCLFGHAKSAAPLLDDGGARDEFERNARAQAAELRARR